MVSNYVLGGFEYMYHVVSCVSYKEVGKLHIENPIVQSCRFKNSFQKPNLQNYLILHTPCIQ